MCESRGSTVLIIDSLEIWKFGRMTAMGLMAHNGTNLTGVARSSPRKIDIMNINCQTKMKCARLKVNATSMPKSQIYQQQKKNYIRIYIKLISFRRNRFRWCCKLCLKCLKPRGRRVQRRTHFNASSAIQFVKRQ